MCKVSAASHIGMHTYPCNDPTSVLSQAFVEDAVRLLVTRFIPLDPSDLEEWMSDPEEWVNLEEKENEQWEYELRVSYLGVHSHLLVWLIDDRQPCGERVLMTLAYQYRQYVIPLLLTTFEQIVGTCFCEGSRDIDINSFVKPSLRLISRVFSRRRLCIARLDDARSG